MLLDENKLPKEEEHNSDFLQWGAEDGLNRWLVWSIGLLKQAAPDYS